MLLIGQAELVVVESELNNAVELLSEKSPNFKDKIDNGGLASTAIFKIKTKEIEYLDWSQESRAVHKITL